MTEKSNNQSSISEQKTSSNPNLRRHRSLLVRYGKNGHLGQFRHSEREIPPGVTHVVAKTERGMEIGKIVSPFCHQRGYCNIGDTKIDHYCKSSGPDYPFTRNGTIVRFATAQDLKEQHHINLGLENEIRYCRELIEKYKLAMSLIDGEHLFGGERIIFYFMAESRVDFRDLVKELARQYQTRIEMRQIGARDEARLIADFETCGRECCCKNFLKVLQPVNMRMAKLQKATLDPSKISGRCGRLKCCLRYEDEVYNELRKQLPRKNTFVLVDQGYGTVLETHVLTQLVKIRLEATGRIIAVNEDEILERNYHPPAKPIEKPEPAQEDEKTKNVDVSSEPPKSEGTVVSDGKPELTEGSAKPKKRRRRRRKKGTSKPEGEASNRTGGNDQKRME